MGEEEGRRRGREGKGGWGGREREEGGRAGGKARTPTSMSKSKRASPREREVLKINFGSLSYPG